MFLLHVISLSFRFFFFNDTATTEIYTLSLHDALPISPVRWQTGVERREMRKGAAVVFLPFPHPDRDLLTASQQDSRPARSEEHTSELQSPCNLVCRLLLEKKKKHQPR